MKYFVGCLGPLTDARQSSNNNDNNNNNDLEVAHRQSGSPSTWFLVELEFGNVGFWGEGKTREPGEKPLGAKKKQAQLTYGVDAVYIATVYRLEIVWIST